MEELIRTVFKETLDVDLPNPFPRMTYAETMRRYGSDKPDLRITLELAEVTDAVKDVAFKCLRASPVRKMVVWQHCASRVGQA